MTSWAGSLDRPEGRRRRAPLLTLLAATGLGTGYAPFAPGTFGSLPGLLLVWLLWGQGPLAAVGGLLVVVALGFWSAGAAAEHFGRRDPGHVVVDEIAGQMTSLLFMDASVRNLIAGFFLFRLLDVIKPFPAGRLEELPGASGIMADDLMAGVYANLALRALHWGFPALWGA